MFMLFLCIWIHFIWRPGNPEPFISSSWKLWAVILKPYVEQHHRVLFLITLKNSLILSTELCIPLHIRFSPSCPELIYHLALISKVSLVLFYRAVNAIPCCALVFHLLWVTRSFSSPISLYFEQDLLLNCPLLLCSSTWRFKKSIKRSIHRPNPNEYIWTGLI